MVTKREFIFGKFKTTTNFINFEMAVVIVYNKSDVSSFQMKMTLHESQFVNPTNCDKIYEIYCVCNIVVYLFFFPPLPRIPKPK